MYVIIRNQDIRKLETTCFGLTLAIFRFHLGKKLIVRFVIIPPQGLSKHHPHHAATPTCADTPDPDIIVFHICRIRHF